MVLSVNKYGRQGAHDVPWGTGEGNVEGVLAEVHRQGLQPVFAIEYEYHWNNSLPEIAQCVKYFDQVAKQWTSADKPEPPVSG